MASFTVMVSFSSTITSAICEENWNRAPLRSSPRASVSNMRKDMKWRKNDSGSLIIESSSCFPLFAIDGSNAPHEMMCSILGEYRLSF